METKKNGYSAVMGGILAVWLMACSSGASVEGEWIEPVPGMEHLTQGISLQPDGKASSIHMATLQYESWNQEGDNLILTGKSIGNHQTLAFSDTLVIEKVTSDSLVLKRGSLRLKYAKKK